DGELGEGVGRTDVGRADEEDQTADMRGTAEGAVSGLRLERCHEVPAMHRVEADGEVLRHREARGHHGQAPVVLEAGAGDGQEVDLEYDLAVHGGGPTGQGDGDMQTRAPPPRP